MDRCCGYSSRTTGKYMVWHFFCQGLVYFSSYFLYFFQFIVLYNLRVVGNSEVELHPSLLSFQFSPISVTPWMRFLPCLFIYIFTPTPSPSLATLTNRVLIHSGWLHPTVWALGDRRSDHDFQDFLIYQWRYSKEIVVLSRVVLLFMLDI